jgi:two-component system heavy metal sensor histidine kinase CusS
VKSIGARLALWYALAATVTFACLSVVGYFMLEKHLIHGLDLLNAAEFQQIEAHLGPDHKTLNAEVIEARIRETTEYASVLFYIDVHRKDVGMIFRSTNLHGQTIPDIPHQRTYNAALPATGEMRVGEFILAPFDVMMATPLRPVLAVMDGYVEVSAALIAVMLVVSAALGFGLSRLALRPLRLIQATANRIRSDHMSERIAVADVRDEVSNLARLLNQMFDRLESSFDQTRRFTADASHELKTPLSLMRLQTEKLLSEEGVTPSQEEAFQGLLDEMDRLDKIVEDLLFLSRAESGVLTLDLQPQQPDRFLQTFEQDARVLAEHLGLECVCAHEGDGLVSFDGKWIRQVLLNLVKNSLGVASPGSLITVSSTVVGEMWRVSVEDDGPGVPEEQREHIFERFVRIGVPARANDQGCGLGLAICRSIVELHGGRISAAAGTAGRGLRVTFEIPVFAYGVRAVTHFRRTDRALLAPMSP